MKVKNFTEEDLVVKSGEFQETEFKIEAGPFAFQILSASLYSKKIQSVIRELSTNAMDEHTSAGIDRQFEVHLPTSFEKWFSIRDYGKGLSDIDARTLYTTFFKSTKRNNNQVVGCLGLGSKSPFAVTNSFTVESFFEGNRTVYTCFKEGGCPKIAMIESGKSDEPSGVSIKFSTEGTYYWEWEEEAVRVYKFFKNPPALNISDINLSLGDVKVGGEGWSMYSGIERENYAVMGDVAYPIEMSSIKTENEKERKLISDLENCSGIVFRFPLGAINFLPSREGLEYDNITKNALISSIRNMFDEMQDRIKSTVESQPNMFNARKGFVRQLNMINEVFPSFKNKNLIIPKWNGQDLFNSNIGYILTTDKEHSFVAFNSGKKNGSISIAPGYVKLSYNFDSDIKKKWFVCDEIRGNRERIRKHLLETSHIGILVKRDAAIAIGEMLGLDDISELFIEAESIPKHTAKQMKIFEVPIDIDGNLDFDKKTSKTIMDDEETFYVIRNGKRVILFDNGKDKIEVDFNSLYQHGRLSGMTLPKNVMTITMAEHRIEKLADNPNMINLSMHIAESLKEHCNEKFSSVVSKISNCPIISDLNNIEIADWIKQLKKHRSKIDNDHPLVAVIDYNRIEWNSRKDAYENLGLNDNDFVVLNSCTGNIWISTKASDGSRVGKNLFILNKDNDQERNNLWSVFLNASGKIATNAYSLYGMVDLHQNESIGTLNRMAKNPIMPNVTIGVSSEVSPIVVDFNFES